MNTITGCEFGDTPEEAAALVKENMARKAVERAASLRAQADDLPKQAAAMEAGK